jgi:predicted lysophospholipase L1 biosynthesis ABC-type transport system permease subunit
MRIHISQFRSGPQLDMTPDGQFLERPRETPAEKLLRYGIVVAVIAGLVALAAFALWLALILIPVVILAAAVAYAAFRWRMWKLGRSAGGQLRPPFGG